MFQKQRGCRKVAFGDSSNERNARRRRMCAAVNIGTLSQKQRYYVNVPATERRRGGTRGWITAQFNWSIIVRAPSRDKRWASLE